MGCVMRVSRVAIGSISFLLMVMAVAEASPSLAEHGDLPRLTQLLPQGVNGYAGERPDKIYTAKTLFDLIDGGAEVYRALNVQRVVSRRYLKSGSPDIIADIFDMGSSEDAFGAFHHDLREGNDVDIGHESEHSGNVLLFWKDRYFISLLAFDETRETMRVLKALGKSIAASIRHKGRKPSLLNRLPQIGLQTRTVSYFHDWTY